MLQTRPISRAAAILAYTLALVALFSATVQAGIIAPDTLIAGENATVTITGTFAKDSENRKNYDGYRVYLALTVPGWGTGPECWLANNLDMEPQRVTVVVPAEVAPNGTKVQFADSLIKKGKEGVQGYTYSGPVTLNGGNGTWSQRELDGRNKVRENSMSCWAFGCVRRCDDEYYTGEKSSEDAADKCAEACLKNSGASSRVPMLVVLLGTAVAAVAQLIL